jgi:hypothetical protein
MPCGPLSHRVGGAKRFTPLAANVRATSCWSTVRMDAVPKLMRSLAQRTPGVWLSMSPLSTLHGPVVALASRFDLLEVVAWWGVGGTLVVSVGLLGWPARHRLAYAEQPPRTVEVGRPTRTTMPHNEP